MPAPPVIVVHDLIKRFRVPGATTTFVALTLPSLEVCGGEAVAVVGPSGSGKTTLFHILAGLLSPSQGEVLIHGVSLGILHGKDRDRWRARTIGYAFQSFNLLAAFSALENVCLALDLGTTVPRAARRARARALLDELGLGSRMHHRPGELSTGEQQRVAVARALANAPEVLLADEPTASVDPETREVVLSRLLREVHISKKVLLVATHDRSLLTRFDRVVHLDQPDLPAATPC